MLAVSSLALLAAFYTSKTKAETELQEKADEYTAFIKDTLVLPLWNYDFETIHAVCRTYLQNDLITGVKVTDVRRQININMTKEGVNPSVVRNVDLYRGGSLLGRVSISMTYGYLTDLNRRFFWSFALTILTNLATVLVLTGILLRMSLKRPLDQLNAIVDSYAAGNYRPLHQESPHVEFQSLVATLEQMGEKIKTQLSTIQKAEKKYRSIFENAIEGIYQSTPEGRILSANPAFAQILGYESPEQLMQTLTDIGAEHWVEPGDRASLVQALISGQEEGSSEARLIRRDGQKIWILINGRPVYDANGALSHLEGMVQDITQRKKAESELRRLSTVVEQVADCIFIANDQGVIDYVNPAFEKITGYSRNEVMGRKPSFLGADRREATLYKEIISLVSKGEVWSGRITNMSKSGFMFIVEATVSPIKSHSGRFIGSAAVSRDVTEKVRFENQIRQTQKMEAIGTLAGGIAHDFNNMLGVIIGCIELAMDGSPREGLVRDDLEKALDAGLRAKFLVRQILTFSRQGESELKPLLLKPFIKEVIKFLHATLPASVKLRLNLKAEKNTVLADPTQVQQVLLNLCTNSAHALEPDGGIIEVILSELEIGEGNGGEYSDIRSGLYLNLTVKDNGRGIPEEHLDRIFDPFFTTKKVGQGTGLGLSVVHGIVKNHGGTINVRSDPGQGTSIQVILPSLDHPGIDPASEASVDPPEGDEAVLLVEDEPILANIIKRILGGLGYKVKAFADGRNAVEFFRDNKEGFDLILLDQNMPDISGVEAAASMLRARPDIPAVIYTGLNMESLQEDAKKAGVKTIINKPLNRIELAVAIRKALDD